MFHGLSTLGDSLNINLSTNIHCAEPETVVNTQQY